VIYERHGVTEPCEIYQRGAEKLDDVLNWSAEMHMPERWSSEPRSGVGQMTEIFKCPHCGAMYEITHEKSASHDEQEATDCQVCGKPMDSISSSSIRGYELVKMPDGTSV
jgi:hypothetical protein